MPGGMRKSAANWLAFVLFACSAAWFVAAVE